jgi:homoserine kinase type II
MQDNVFMLWFVQEQEEAADIELLLGLYATEAEARAAIERRKNKPGFMDYPDGFQIHERTLGVEGWVDGFVRDKK